MAEKMINTAEAASALAARKQREQSEARQVYNTLMIKPNLTPAEAEALAKAVATLDVPGERIAADSRAAQRALHLHEVKRVAFSDETQKARENTRLAVERHIEETDRLMAERMKVLDQLREDQHRAEATYLSYHSADAELRGLENEFPFLTGLRQSK